MCVRRWGKKIKKKFSKNKMSGPGSSAGGPMYPKVEHDEKAFGNPLVQPQPQSQQWGVPYNQSVDLYGERIAEELQKLKLTMDEIKTNVDGLKKDRESDKEKEKEKEKEREARREARKKDPKTWNGMRRAEEVEEDSDSDSYSDDYSDSPVSEIDPDDIVPGKFTTKAYDDDYGYDDGYGYEGAYDDGAFGYGHGSCMRHVGEKDVWSPTEWKFTPGAPGHCGRRVRILWLAGEQRVQASGKNRSTGKDQWWGGYVALFNEAENLHKIHYDDGEVECLDLAGATHNFTDFSPKDVGRRVSVHWPLEERRYLMSSASGKTTRWCNNPDGKWYPGVVSEMMRFRFLPEKGYHKNYFVSDACVIKYDDGDVELIDVAEKDVKFLSAPEDCVKVGDRIEVLWRKATRKDLTRVDDRMIDHDTYREAVVTAQGCDGNPNQTKLTYDDARTEVLDLRFEQWHKNEHNRPIHRAPQWS